MTGNDVAVVVPVFREAQNVGPLITELHEHLSRYDWEVVFVDDDSDDGTAEVVRSHARTDNRVRLVLRVKERGLATAGVAGMLTSKARWLVLMDGDGQHDPRYILDLIEPIASGKADLVSAARQFEQLSDASLAARRRRLSVWANRLAELLTKRRMQDPMTGFFAISADGFHATVRRLSAGGFKLLIDLLISNPELRHLERPFEFRVRRAGVSKLDVANAWEFLCFIISKAANGILPPTFVSFLLVGATGVLVHFAILYPALWSSLTFAQAQLGAALGASAWNFGLNNVLTFRDRRLAGWSLAGGFIKYLLISAVGIAANVAVAATVFQEFHFFVPLSALCGIAVDAVWKYFMSSLLVWRR